MKSSCMLLNSDVFMKAEIFWENVKATCENKSNKFSINVQYVPWYTVPTINIISYSNTVSVLLSRIWSRTASDIYEGCQSEQNNVTNMNSFVYMCVHSLYLTFRKIC
jgi:hypothetical protein